jgi:hypothetical protein
VRACGRADVRDERCENRKFAWCWGVSDPYSSDIQAGKPTGPARLEGFCSTGRTFPREQLGTAGEDKTELRKGSDILNRMPDRICSLEASLVRRSAVKTNSGRHVNLTLRYVLELRHVLDKSCRPHYDGEMPPFLDMPDVRDGVAV